jgi:hypothetical protein
MPRAVRVSRAGMSAYQSEQDLVFSQVGENVKLRQGACARCTPPVPRRAASVADDTRMPLDAEETRPEAMGPSSAEKPRQHLAGLLLFDDTTQWPV